MGKNTICIHSGNQIDPATGGSVTPIYPGTAYAYLGHEKHRYPRYFNTPNQEAVIQKLCALEGAETGILFGSGMAAISTALLAHLKSGDHAVFQKGLYGGTTHFIRTEFEQYGLSFSFTDHNAPEGFAEKIQPNTRLIFIETPSNPLLEIVDIAGVAQLAREKGLLTVIDNTFASPINQHPIALGIDIVMHSATKYLGGHSDICAGVLLGKKEHLQPIEAMAKNLGGSMNAQTCSLLERSIKTLNLRIRQQNANALEVARFLHAHPRVAQTNYPGLESHPNHTIAKAQMEGFGGMLSFEVGEGMDAIDFQQQLRLILAAQSLGGVESTICASTLTSHAYLTEEQKREEGISDRLLRLSVGIEEAEDLIADLKQALESLV